VTTLAGHFSSQMKFMFKYYRPNRFYKNYRPAAVFLSTRSLDKAGKKQQKQHRKEDFN
jgi:hypothetical protein